MPLMRAAARVRTGARRVVATMTAEVFVIDNRSGRVIRRVELPDTESPVRQLAWLRPDSVLVVLGDAPQVVRVE